MTFSGKFPFTFPILCFVCISISGLLADTPKVIDGKAADVQSLTMADAVRLGEWEQCDGYIQSKEAKLAWPFTSHGNMLVFGRTLDCSQDFHIKAKLALVKKQATAASLMIGRSNFLFDGAGGMLAVEGTDFERVGVIANSSALVRAGIPFLFECVKKGNTVEFYIDGKKVADTLFQGTGQLPVGLRPFRGIMQCYDFSVTGKLSYKFTSDVSDELYKKKSFSPVSIAPICVKDGAEIVVPLSTPIDDCKNLKLVVTSLRDGSKVPLPLDGLLNSDKMSVTVKVPSSITDVAFFNSQFKLIPVNISLVDNAGRIGGIDTCLHDGTSNGFPSNKVAKSGDNICIFAGDSQLGTMQGYLAYSDWNLAEPSIREMYAAGIRQFKLLLDPYEYMRPNGSFNMDGFFLKVSSLSNRIIIEAPDARLLFQWKMYVPKWWTAKYPDELIKFNKHVALLQWTPGDTVQPSYASKLWRKTYADILQAFITKLSQSYLADRIIGIRLCYANCGEWNNWGYHFQAFPDYSKPMNDAFAQWLLKKYGSVAGLQKAWSASMINLANVVPSATVRLSTAPTGTIRDLSKGIAARDYYEFWQWCTVETIEYFAKVIKEASNNKLLCGAYYGYYVGHLAGGTYHFQDSGHYGMKYLLESPYIDYVGGPNLYNKRREYTCMNSVFSSVPLHGKLWVVENDQRTDRSALGQTEFGRTDNVQETIAVFQRDFMNFYAKGSSYYYFDFAGDWFRSKPLMKEIGKLKKIEKLAYESPSESSREVALIVSEETIPYYSSGQGVAAAQLQSMIGCDMDFTGAPWDFYLLSDIDKMDFSHYKLVIFANAFYISEPQRQTIKTKILKDGRTVVFLYAAGMNTENKFDASGLKSLAGIDVKIMPYAMISNLRSSNTNAKMNMTAPVKFGPMLVSSDKTATVLGYLNDDKTLPAAVEKNTKDAKVIWIGFPKLDVHWLKYLYYKSGVHVYTQRPDAFYQRGNFYCVYSRIGGKNTIKFDSAKETVVDLISGQTIASNANSIVLNFPGVPQTRIIYAGPATEALRKYLNDISRD